MAPERDRSIRLPVTDDELRMAHELAAQAKLSVTKFLRALIRDLHAERIGKSRTRRKPTK